MNGYVYTVDADRSVVNSVAVRAGEIVFVGSDAEAKAFQGDKTRIVDLGGRMMLPGLHDVHIHLSWSSLPRARAGRSSPKRRWT